jgi:hypothetical protein
VVEPKKLSYFGEVYKYDQNLNSFTNSALSNFTISYENLTANTANTLSIQSSVIGEGEFLIKSYWDYDVNTLLAKKQKIRKESISTYKRGELYGLYVPETDWYFISLYEASKPNFNNSTAPIPNSVGTLVVSSQLTQSGNTKYYIRGLSQPIVSFNGSVLANNIEYSAVTSGSSKYLILSFEPLDNQILTYAYIDNGAENDLIPDLYTITDTIKSGSTGTQLPTDRVFYNTTENKYEFYLISEPASDVLLTINGSVLTNNVEYYISTSNVRRIILEENIKKGDIIEAFYQPKASVNGGIRTNSPNISWFIDTPPLSVNGKFTIEFTDVDDNNFENVIYSFEIDYIVSQKSYSKNVVLTNAKAGDKFIYRIKNEKFYNPIIGETIYSVSYSDVNNIEILVNSGQSY